jgi:hypothetical protein
MQPSNSTFAQVFNSLPVSQLLTVAKEIQQRIQTDASLVTLKDKTEYVTKADYALQQIILDYFAQSALAGTYRICSEETLDQDQQVQVTNPTWELILDPLDGTTAFCEQKDTWGVMIGARDLQGQIVYSWNLVSTGEVYSTSSAVTQLIDSVNTQLERVDIYDYGVNKTQFFPQQTAYPAAVWTGWQLYQNHLDGLLWLPSNAGKKTYPAYDLIFLGALSAQGWLVHTEKVAGQINKVAVARNQHHLNQLLTLSV